MRFGRFSMRSDPLLLAQIAEGKQRYVQFRCPRPRGTACAFPNDRVVCARTGESSRVGIDFIASRSVHVWAAGVPFRFRPFQSLRVHLCSGVNSYEGSRGGTIGNASCKRSSVAPQSGDKKIRRQKNYRRKDRPQIPSFRANNYRINYSAGSASARALLVHAIHAHAHTRVKRRGYTDKRGEGTATVRH